MNARYKTFGRQQASLVALGAAVLAFSAGFAVSAAGPDASSPPALTNSGWRRIVMIGASATAGFVVTEPLGGTNTLKCRLDRYVDAALLAPHEPVRNLASSFFFTQPEAQGQRQIEQALQAQPTVVIGADFLFWFCYGAGNTEEDRLQRFENGLKLLEKIPGPLLIGDLPDASAAVNGILSPEQIPGAPTLAAANRRLQAWAALHPQVVVLPLANFMRAAMSNEALTIHGQTLGAGKTRGLLQNDKLHPTPAGSATLAVAIVDALQSAQPGRFAGEVRWDPEEVLRLGLLPAIPTARSNATARSAAPGGSAASE